MTNLQQHFLRELKALGYEVDHLEEQPESPNKWIVQNLLELEHTFSNQGHSGSSAPYVLGLFKTLANFEPASPLKGTDDEWNEVGPGVFQNNRCPHVFKEADRFDGKPYDSAAVIFKEENGSCYTSRDSAKRITFPYTPQREYVRVS